MAEPVTKEWLERTFEDVKNWGRWGPDDERGALNYITDKKRAAAAALVRDGESVSCALELPLEPASDNPHPAQHMMLVAGDACGLAVAGMEMTTDFIGVAFHGMSVSHLDALCHISVKGRMYNGFDVGEVKSIGAQRNTVMEARDGIASRGVLLDIPRLRGVPWLERGDRVTVEELEAAEEAQGVRVEEGDILLFGTGRDALRASQGPWPPTEGLAGLDARCIPWLHERRIAVLGNDGVSDAVPGPDVEDWVIPLHQCCIAGMGVPLLDNLALDRLAAACAARERWEFFFLVAPLRVEGCTGSPINPIAVF